MQIPYMSKLGLPAKQFSVGMSQGGYIPSASFMTPQTNGPSFKDVMGGTLKNINDTVTAPTTLMNQAVTTGNVDVHDVIIANAKAELAVNMTAQITTKVVQAYDKILQIQV